MANSSTRADDFAFLVAVQDYDVKQLDKLQYARNDILEFSRILISSGYDADNVVVMHDDLAKLGGIRFVPESRKIRRELKLLLGALEAEDSVIIAFAGHGAQFKGEQQSYFCPLDTDLADKSTLISLNEVYEALKNTQARKRLLLVDACRNDPQSKLSRTTSRVELESITRPQLTPPPQGGRGPV